MEGNYVMDSIVGPGIPHSQSFLLVVKEIETYRKICTVSSHTLRGPACLLLACCQKYRHKSEQKSIENEAKK